MIPSFRCVSVALTALLTTASACLGAEPGYGPNKGGVGGGIGGSKFVQDGDYSEGSALRFAFSGTFRYVMRPWLRWQVSPGLTWSAYQVGTPAPFPDPDHPQDVNKDETLSLMVPVSAQVQLVERRGWWLYHFGAGPGVYRVWVENRRDVIQDPVTHRRHRGSYFGVTGEIGAERFLRTLTTTSVEGVVAGHLVFAERDDQFPSGWNSNVLPIEFRIGVNYYFDMLKSKPSLPTAASPKP